MDKDKITLLATEAFEKAERLRLMGMQNVSREYEQRKADAVQYALAEAAANEARSALYLAIEGK